MVDAICYSQCCHSFTRFSAEKCSVQCDQRVCKYMLKRFLRNNNLQLDLFNHEKCSSAVLSIRVGS